MRMQRSVVIIQQLLKVFHTTKTTAKIYNKKAEVEEKYEY